MRISELYARAKNHDAAAKVAGTDKDIDVETYLDMAFQAADKERHDKIAEGMATKAYATSDVSVPFLPGFSVGYSGLGKPIADLVCPVVPGNVARRFAKEDRRDHSRLYEQAMGPKDMPPEVSIDISSGTYTEKLYGAHSIVANSDIALATDIPDLMAKHAVAIYEDIIRGREYRVATLLGTYGNYGTNCSTQLTSTNRWDVGPATSTADPVKDILNAKHSPYVAGTPNCGFCSAQVWQYLRSHPKFIAVAGPRAADRVLAIEEVRQMLELDYFFVGDMKYDSTGNVSTATYAYLWGKVFGLITVEPGAKLGDHSFAKTFRHLPLQFSQWLDPRPGHSGVTYVKGAVADAEKVTASDQGYLLYDVIS